MPSRPILMKGLDDDDVVGNMLLSLCYGGVHVPSLKSQYCRYVGTFRKRRKEQRITNEPTPCSTLAERISYYRYVLVLSLYREWTTTLEKGSSRLPPPLSTLASSFAHRSLSLYVPIIQRAPEANCHTQFKSLELLRSNVRFFYPDDVLYGYPSSQIRSDTNLVESLKVSFPLLLLVYIFWDVVAHFGAPPK
jgi:hypothetical protein